MKGLIRGVASAAVVLGATACTDDYSIDFGGAPTAVQASPEVMFINSGATKEVLVRLVNDRNQSVPAEYTVSNVGAGLTVTYDATYRPEWSSTDPVLEPPAVKIQQRYTVTANIPTGGQRTYTLTSGGMSTTGTVYVLPTNMGASLSATAPALGEEVTITAPEGQSFTATATVAFETGGAPIITNRTAKSITFLPRPGSTGAATVTGVTLDYAPTLAARTLSSTNAITVPAVTGIPAVVAAGGVHVARTVTATGFKFLPTLAVRVGDFTAITVSVAPDSLSAQVIFPAGINAATATYSNVILGFLPEVPLQNIPATTTITTATTPYNGANPDGSALVINANAPGVALTVRDTWINFGADVLGFGGSNKFYRLVLPSTGSRTYTLNWTADGTGVVGDFDFAVCDDALAACPVARLTAARPETGSANLAAGNWWLVAALFLDEHPGMLTFTIQ